MISTLANIKNNFTLKIFGSSYNSSEAENLIKHKSQFQEALNDITFKESCRNTEFNDYLLKIGLNQDCSSKPEAILKVLKCDENISKKHEIILEFCEITSNLVNNSISIGSKNIQGVKYCDTFSPYIPTVGNNTKLTELIANPKPQITHDLFLKLADSLTISSIHYLNLILEYTSINGCLSMLTFCPKVVIILGLYQAFYFIQTQWVSPEGFYNFLIQLKGHFLQVNALVKQARFSFLPNIEFCYGCLSGGVLLGGIYLFSILNVKTGSMVNMLAQIPQPNLGLNYLNKYALPASLLPIKNVIDSFILPVVHHSASFTSQIYTAAITGFMGPEKLTFIQNQVNLMIRKFLNLESVSYTNIKK